MPFAALLALPLIAGLLGAAPPAAPATDPPQRSLLRFHVDPQDRMTVPIRFARGGPHRFLIDTGAEQSAVSIELARSLNLARLGYRRVYSFAGEQRVPVVRIPQLTVDRHVHRQVDALTFGRGAMGADGLLGIDRLAGQQILFDFKHHTLAISPAPRIAEQAAKGEVLVRAHLKTGRLVMSRARANRVKIDVILDTGTGVSIGNAALRRELERKGRIGPLRRISMLAITGEIVEVDYGLLKQVVIDRSVVIERMPIAFAVTQPFDYLGLGDRPAMLLGMDVLRSFGEVTVDFRNRKVRFRARDDSQRLPPSRFGFTDQT